MSTGLKPWARRQAELGETRLDSRECVLAYEQARSFGGLASSVGG